ncbi:hypothetical protein [Catenulispora subtropica]|uniref:Aldo/keto reductase n=1 Tax=Catenulispora subtropica TaxID=450798 RepID=A0ABN2RN08_9ACTN
MQHVTLGSLDVARIGLGVMSMAGIYSREGLNKAQTRMLER